MSAKHTPGPWKVYDPEMPDTKATYGIDGPQGQPVVYFGITHNDGINLLADARLIAAAPELLEALKLAYDAMSGSTDKTILIRAHKAAEAAIDKAIG